MRDKFTALLLQIQVLWDVMSYRLVKVDVSMTIRSFETSGGIYSAMGSNNPQELNLHFCFAVWQQDTNSQPYTQIPKPIHYNSQPYTRIPNTIH